MMFYLLDQNGAPEFFPQNIHSYVKELLPRRQLQDTGKQPILEEFAMETLLENLAVLHGCYAGRAKSKLW